MTTENGSVEEQSGLPKVTMQSVLGLMGAIHECPAEEFSGRIVDMVTLLDLVFKEGFKLCLRTYGIWRDGEQTIGAMGKNIKQVAHEVEMATFGCTDDGLLLVEFPY